MMGIDVPSIRWVIAACAMMIGLPTLADRAEAATVYTYSFEQDGYRSGLTTGVLSGSFSGTLESNGSIQLADLTDFSLNFKTYAPDGYYTGLPHIDISGDLSDLTSFSWRPGNLGSSLFVIARGVYDAAEDFGICAGGAAAFGLCGGTDGSYTGAFSITPTGRPFGPDTFVPFRTSAPPQITLISVATTPIAPALPLFASAMGALGLLAWRKRRPQRRGI
jgi:hypothetical protein